MSTIQDFKSYLNEAGAEAGKLELVKTDLEKAYAYAKAQFEKNGKDIDQELPNFKENYAFAQKQAGTGRTVRKDMPVIDNADVKKFQEKLKKGHLDVNTPLGKKTDKSDQFPEKLKGQEAKDFLDAGKKRNDQEKKDDQVTVKKTTVEVGKLSPIQKQIYFDKSIDQIAKAGAKGSEAFLKSKSNTFVISDDLSIIDGHHRFLSAILIDPKMKVNSIKVGLPIKKLLPVSLSYGDAIGNERNA